MVLQKEMTLVTLKKDLYSVQQKLHNFYYMNWNFLGKILLVFSHDQ